MPVEITSRISSGPASEPVTKTEVKAHLRLADAVTADDAYLDNLIAAARQQVERETGLAFVTETIIEKRHDFPRGEMFMRLFKRTPLLTVTSIAYLDGNGDSQTWDSSNYTVDVSRRPGCVWLAYNTDWPTTRKINDAVTTTYTAGYATAGDIPFEHKAAVLLAIELMYEDPHLIGPAAYDRLQKRYDDLIEKIRVPTYP